MTEGNEQVQVEIYSVLTALQFQDRVSQMLEHAEHNLQDLYENQVLYNSIKGLDNFDPNNIINSLRITCTLIPDSGILYTTREGDRPIAIVNFQININGDNLAEYNIPFYQSTGNNSSTPGYWFPFSCLSEIDENYIRTYPKQNHTRCYIPFRNNNGVLILSETIFVD